MHRPLDRAERHGHVAAQADGVRGPVHLEPLVGGDLVGARHLADLIVKDLGRRGAGGQHDEDVQGLVAHLVRDPDRGGLEEAGCSSTTASTSAQETFSPARLIMSLARPTKNRTPSASVRATSPVCSRPPGGVSEVAAGCRGSQP